MPYVLACDEIIIPAKRKCKFSFISTCISLPTTQTHKPQYINCYAYDDYSAFISRHGVIIICADSGPPTCQELEIYCMSMYLMNY